MSLVVFCCLTQALLLAKTLKAIRTEGKNFKTWKNTSHFFFKSYFLLFLNFLTISSSVCLWINMFMSLETIRERRRGENSFNHSYISYIHRKKKIVTRSKMRVNWSKKHEIQKKKKNEEWFNSTESFLFSSCFPSLMSSLSSQHLDLVSLTATGLGFPFFRLLLAFFFPSLT